MLDPTMSPVRNRVLRALPAEGLQRLAGDLVHVALTKGDVVVEAAGEITGVVFPETGILSVIVSSPEGLSAEAGLFGRDGFGPVAAALQASRSTNEIVVQVDGAGWRIPHERLVAAMSEDEALRSALLHYVHTFAAQVSFTALSNAVHNVDERLARWLLMCDDRLDGNLALTHEFLSVMLGVRRSTVTTTLHVLEGNGFIRSERNSVVIRDRAGLEEFAGDAYGRAEAVQAEYFPVT